MRQIFGVTLGHCLMVAHSRLLNSKFYIRVIIHFQMSRGRKRKSQKGTFSEEDMRRAVRQVLVGEGGIKLSLRKAAAQNRVSFQTLQRYVKKEQNKTNSDVQLPMKSNYKHRLVFSDEEEKDLVNYVIKCSKMCYGKSTKDTRLLAYEMAKINSKKIPLSWEKNKSAGIDWLQGFLKRHNNELSIRQPEGCSLSRASSFNEYNVNLFFDNLEVAYSRSKKFCDGTRIYNLDETGTTTVQKPKKVLSSKGTKQVSQCTSGERGVLITTCCIISATGNALPPAMVFPRKKCKHHMLNGAPSGTLGLASPSGWMNGELFPSVMKHFIQHSGSSKENPTILIFDNHESHLTIETLNLAKESGVIIVTLPPHCSHKLQPLDTSVFASFKANYNTAVDSWLLHHPGIPLSIYDVSGCVGVAFERSMTPSNIKSGFRKTGIYPFDRKVFTSDDFLSSSVTDRDISNATSVLLDSDKQIASTSSEEPCLVENPSDKASEQVFVSPEVFKGYPKAGERKVKISQRKRATSCIPTDTPEKEKIEMKYMEKKEKENMKKKKQAATKNLFSKKRKTIPKDISSDEEDEEISLNDDSDGEATAWVPEAEPSGFEELDKDPEPDDFVLVQFKAKNDVFYIGKVVELKELSNDIVVNFLRKSTKFDGHFIFPTIPDVAIIPLNDIKMILPRPSLLGNTKRLQSYYKFEINFNHLNMR